MILILFNNTNLLNSVLTQATSTTQTRCILFIYIYNKKLYLMYEKLADFLFFFYP